MKQKFAIINFVLSVTVLFSVLFQSIHSYVHHSQTAIEEIIIQKKSENKSEITNAHSITLHCAACDFHFSCFTSAEYYVYRFCKTIVVKSLTSAVTVQHSPFFIGSLFSLRGPPTL